GQPGGLQELWSCAVFAVVRPNVLLPLFPLALPSQARQALSVFGRLLPVMAAPHGLRLRYWQNPRACAQFGSRIRPLRSQRVDLRERSQTWRRFAATTSAEFGPSLLFPQCPSTREMVT